MCNVTEEECRNHQSVRHTSNTFRFRKVKRHKVLTALKEIKPNKETWYDMLPPRVLKMAAEQLATPLTPIFNQAKVENHWTNAWKRGEWIPIFKKEDPQERANYRPVTVLTAVDKVLIS